MSKFRFYIQDNARNGKLWDGSGWVSQFDGNQKGYSSPARALNAARKLVKDFRALKPVIVEEENGWISREVKF